MEKVSKSEKEWSEILTPEAFRVCRKKGTEPAFSGNYHDSKKKGDYRCVCCGNTLFNSSAKFDSGTGWPSFYEAVSDKNVSLKEDKDLSMIRTEVVCARCDCHLGHVFDDGPDPTGKRYCINSVSLDFEEKGTGT